MGRQARLRRDTSTVHIGIKRFPEVSKTDTYDLVLAICAKINIRKQTNAKFCIIGVSKSLRCVPYSLRHRSSYLYGQFLVPFSTAVWTFTSGMSLESWVPYFNRVPLCVSAVNKITASSTPHIVHKFHNHSQATNSHIEFLIFPDRSKQWRIWRRREHKMWDTYKVRCFMWRFRNSPL